MKHIKKMLLIIMAFIVTTSLVIAKEGAQEINPPKEAYQAPKKEYSPFVGDHFPTRVLWGDGGWDFKSEDANTRLAGEVGYKKGVPMGGDLSNAPNGNAPTFLVAALKDVFSGNLDRIQIVKGWLDKKGQAHEKVYDVVWSGDRKPNAKGKLPPVGNTVDLKKATWTNTIGAPDLITVWKDPDFNPNQKAFYYARVIEIPTPRWSAYDAVRYKTKMRDDVQMITQERAYTSPIWYTP